MLFQRQIHVYPSGITAIAYLLGEKEIYPTSTFTLRFCKQVLNQRKPINTLSAIIQTLAWRNPLPL